MTPEEHWRRLEKMYLAARCNHSWEGLTMDIGDGTAQVTFAAGVQHHHAADAVHGAYYFKLLDDAAFFAANSKVPDVFVLTASLNVSYLRPVKEGLLRASGKVIRTGANLVFAESLLFDRQGRELARATGTFAKSRKALADIDDYAAD